MNPGTILLEAHFYADTFRSVKIEVSAELEKYPDQERRRVLSEIVAEHLEKRGITWDKTQRYSWYSRTANGYENNVDVLGIGFITCKRI